MRYTGHPAVDSTALQRMSTVSRAALAANSGGGIGVAGADGLTNVEF